MYSQLFCRHTVRDHRLNWTIGGLQGSLWRLLQIGCCCWWVSKHWSCYYY